MEGSVWGDPKRPRQKHLSTPLPHHLTPSENSNTPCDSILLKRGFSSLRWDKSAYSYPAGLVGSYHLQHKCVDQLVKTDIREYHKREETQGSCRRTVIPDNEEIKLSSDVVLANEHYTSYYYKAFTVIRAPSGPITEIA